ncbi:uncharacterized protein B0H18DRAFT_877085, partial [Fomitopsis serialis]|uniref:uncharacterized protein n=1 Tax=Fomitopsis serialis TaxID=139415 RepID=UPI0020088013
RLAPDEAKAVSPREHDGKEVQPVDANGAVLYGQDSQLMGTYCKTNLYMTDMRWAVPGPGFVTFTLPPPLGTVTLTICMDPNPVPSAEWNLDSGPYELTAHCISTKTDLLVLLNVWVDSGDEEGSDEDWGTMNDWATWLRPLWDKPLLDGHGSHSQDTHGELGEEIVVVKCDRFGEENGACFCIMSLCWK